MTTFIAGMVFSYVLHSAISELSKRNCDHEYRFIVCKKCGHAPPPRHFTEKELGSFIEKDKVDFELQMLKKNIRQLKPSDFSDFTENLSDQEK